MVQTPPKPLTLDEFLRLPETKPANEYINGQVIPKPMPQGQHSRLQQKLINEINGEVETHRVALALPELRCTFGGRSIIPDVAIFRWHHLPVNEDGTLANAFQSAPDWAIEILSPDQSSTRVTSHLLHCLAHGCELGWLIDPAEALVQVYQPDQPLQSLENAELLLPVPAFAKALTLTVGDVFSWLRVV